MKRAVVAVLVVILTATPASAALRRPEHRLVQLTNASRVEHGSHRLDVGPRLSRFAEDLARDLARRGTLFHRGGYPCRIWGENVGVGPRVGDIHRAFMRSPGHRANVLDRRWGRIGVGVVRRDGRAWVAVAFCAA